MKNNYINRHLIYKREPWYKNQNIKKYIFQNPWKIVALILAPLFVAITFYFWNQSWEWEDINPISMPPFIRIVLSAFVYLTFWAFLNFVKFYQLLYNILTRTEFKKFKQIIWSWLIIFMYFYVIPFVLSIFNFTITLWYNWLTLLLYISPGIFFAVLLWFLVYVYNKYKTK